MSLSDQLRRRRAKLLEELAELDRAIAAIDGPRLQNRNQPDTTIDTMHATLRQRYSESASGKDKRVSAFLSACRSKGFVSMRDACKQVPVNQGYVSQCLRGKSMPLARAKKIAAVIGYAATPENWPNLGE